MRDLRDPQKLGEALLARKTRPLSKAYDKKRFHVMDVSKDDSMQRVAQAEYAETLKSLK
jgi:hypothetical protein